MKAIIAEIDKKQMIVITEKGDFIKVKRRMSANIGDEIELKPQKTYLPYRRLASMAACILACIFLSTGVYAYYTPYSYVSVDINPSIALSLNRFERVISVKPLNEDAVSLIKDTKSLKNQDVDKALSELLKSASEKGYIDEKIENQVLVVVSTKNPKQEEKLANTLTTAAISELAKVNNNYGVVVEKTSVKNYQTALSNKVSPGMEILAGKLREVNPEIKDEEVKNMTVKEAVHLIKEGKKDAKAAEKDKKDKKDKNKEDHAFTSKDTDGQKGKVDAAAMAEAGKDKKNNEKSKPTGAKDGKYKGKDKDNHKDDDKDDDEDEDKEDKDDKGSKEDRDNKDNKYDKNDKDNKHKREPWDKDKQGKGSDGKTEQKNKKDPKNCDDKDDEDSREGKDD